MIYVKSLAVGLLSLLLGTVVLLVGVMVALSFAMPRNEQTAIGFDPVSMVRSSPFLGSIILVLPPVLLFTLGFLWEFRRLKRRRSATDVGR